jgi:hypothetical protein
MDEPELPGIPPPPPPPEPPRPPWYKPLQSQLFGRWKWPGWAGFLYIVLTEVPDWRHRIDFWLNTAETMGGYLVVKFKQMVPIGTESFRGISNLVEGHQMLDPYH